MKYYEFIKLKMPKRALMEGLAEEAAELAQAALKVVRAEYGENPTSQRPDEAIDDLLMESEDVEIYLDLLFSKRPTRPDNPKWKRWAERLGYGKE